MTPDLGPYAAWLAAALSLAIALGHIIAGGRDTARPLSDATTLDLTARSTALMVWHMMSATLLAVAAAFLWSALRPDDPVAIAAGAAATILSAAFAAIALVMRLRLGVSYLVMPQGPIFVLLAGFGAVAWAPA